MTDELFFLLVTRATQEGVDLLQAGLAVKQPPAIGYAVYAPAGAFEDDLTANAVHGERVGGSCRSLRVAVAGDSQRVLSPLGHHIDREAGDRVAEVDGVAAMLAELVGYRASKVVPVVRKVSGGGLPDTRQRSSSTPPADARAEDYGRPAR